MKILVAGGAGFIGSAFVRLLVRERPDWTIVVFDALTYAGNLQNLHEVDGKYTFRRGDIADADAVRAALREHHINAICNFAAETHVDRSIMSGLEFIHTDVVGTYVLLTEARAAGVSSYVQVSTDEVYGTIPEGTWTEESPLRPNSPYAASKAGGDLQVRAAFQTHGFPAMITRGSNTYGPYHYPEKLIPLFITNLLSGNTVPVYGDGLQVRDWLHVDDHARGVLFMLEHGAPGGVYNLAGGEERTNLDVTRMILSMMGLGEDRIEYVVDRPGHDRRYAMRADKARTLGWAPRVPFADGLRETVAWFRAHEDWWRPLKDGTYKDYYRKQYVERQGHA